MPPSPSAMRAAASKAAASATRATAKQGGAAPPGAYVPQPLAVPPPPPGPPPKWKRMLWAGIFAAVTITATIYGAGLKTQQEWKSEKRKVQEATVDEKVAMFNARRALLSKERDELSLKLEEANRLARKSIETFERLSK